MQSALELRLGEYEAQGKVSRRDYVHFQSLLQKHPSYRANIERELDLMIARQESLHHHDSSSSATSTASRSSTTEATSSLARSSPSSILRKKSAGSLHVTWVDQDRRDLEVVSTKETLRGTKHSSATELLSKLSFEDKENSHVPLAPSVLGKQAILERVDRILRPKDVQGKLSLDEIKTLFVEMCFFARLGFVQPPSCLHCSYRESINRKERSAACTRWVIWRRNATVVLHPDRISDDLIILLQCRAARQLLRGEMVDGCCWNAKSKQVESRR
jgi:hypothetical protein